MHDTDTRIQNGHRLHSVQQAVSQPKRVTAQSDQQRLLAAVEGSPQLQHVITKVATPAGRLMKMIGRALGPAEAEVRFTERITYSEDDS